MRKAHLVNFGGALQQKMTGWLVFLSMTASACTMEALSTAAQVGSAPHAAQKRDDERPVSPSAQTGPRTKEPALSKETTSRLIDKLVNFSDTRSAFTMSIKIRMLASSGTDRRFTTTSNVLSVLHGVTQRRTSIFWIRSTHERLKGQTGTQIPSCIIRLSAD